MPLLVAASGMLWSNSYMLEGISTSVDDLENKKTWQAVQSAFSSETELISNIITDNAHWDDAVTELYGEISEAWINQTWGLSTNDVNYDAAYVIDANGNTLAGYRGGKAVEDTATKYYGSTFTKLMSELPQDNFTFKALSTLIRTHDGLAFVAVAPVLPYTEGLVIPATKPVVLVFSRNISSDQLARISKQYVVDRLALGPPDIRQNANYQLRDRWGNSLATATWEPQHLGYAARKAYFWSSINSILALLAAMLPVLLYLAHILAQSKQRELAASEAARRDNLSGLPNRLYLNELLEDRLKSPKPGELVLLFVDLDGFKAVNDAYNHHTGDKLIVQISLGFRKLVTADVELARLGGDEFAMVLEGPTALPRARQIAVDILHYLKAPFDLDGRIASVGASIGIAMLESQCVEPSEFMRQADIAMYHAKSNGRGRFVEFDHSMDTKRVENLAIADELRNILAQKLLEVAYQPLVDAKTFRVVGVEALARWPKHHARKVTPDRFIAVAEEHGLIDDLAALVLRRACEDAKPWSDLRLSVNMSPIQINNCKLVSDIARIAAESAFPLDRLELEFTERILIQNAARTRNVIQQLHDLGIKIALDDFGTGYASVGYLRDYNFDVVKLDRSLVKRVATDGASMRIVQGTVLIALGLSASVVAEGIECEEEVQLMRLAGCNVMQGYYFGRPQSPQEIESMIDNQPRQLLQRTV